MMKLFSFVGTGDYQETSYSFDGTPPSKPTRYMPVALIELLAAHEQVKELILMVTPEAKATHLKNLETELSRRFPNLPFQVIEYHYADSQIEWTLFEKWMSILQKGDTFAIDLTHGMRNLSILSVPISQFSTLFAEANMTHLFYGNFQPHAPVNPIIDLQNVLLVEEWTYAIRQFLETGQSNALKRLTNHARQTYAMTSETRTLLPFMQIADVLDQFVTYLNLNRYQLIVQHVPKLKKALNVEVPKDARLLPYRLLVEQLREDLAQFINAQNDVDIHIALYDWYMKHNRILQAITVWRESVVTVAARSLGIDPYVQEVRKKLDRTLTAYTKGYGLGEGAGRDENLFFASLHQLSSSCRDNLAHIQEKRNDMNHMGLRESSSGANKLLSLQQQSNIRELHIEVLRHIARMEVEHAPHT